ncbi:MAG: CRTAC1 family protein, partial [Acidimicrobiales bacterium]
PAAGTTPAPRLVDVSSRLEGFRRPNGPQNAGGLAGLAWFDYDADGRLDLFISNNAGHPNALFRNLGNGRFDDVATRAGVANGLGNSGVAVADIDNDGCLDLLAGGTGGVETEHQSPTKLYRNMCNGTFADITTSSGVTGTKTTMPVAFADIDNDSFVDIFLASAGDFKNRKHPNKLYRNNGNNTFTDISATAGIQPNLGADVAGFTDFNNDGLQDIVVFDGNNGLTQPLKGGDPEMFQPIPGGVRVWRNNGDLTFTDVAFSVGLGQSLGFWMSLTLGDVSNTGNLDLFSTNAGRANGGAPFNQFPLGNDVYFPHGLWRNQSASVGPLAGIANVVGGASNTLALANVGPPGAPNVIGLAAGGVGGAGQLLGGVSNGIGVAANPNGGVFYRQSAEAAGLSKLNWGWGASFADFDNDGHQDLFFNGAYPGLGGLIHSAPFIGDVFGNPGYLLRNTGRASFDLVQTFGQQHRFTSGSAAGDFDNDGLVDVAVVNTAHGNDPGAPILLRNESAGTNGWLTLRLVGTRSNRAAIGAKIRVLAGPLTKLQEVQSEASFISVDSLWRTFGLGPNPPATVTVEVTWPSRLIETFRADTGRVVTLREAAGEPLR